MIDITTGYPLNSFSNSSTTPLGIDEIFIGNFENVSNFGAINLTVFTDKISATNGLEFQWSGDGINVDRSEGSNVKANIGRAFSFCPRAKYFRVRYINGNQAQTTFRLNVTYRMNGSGLIARPLNQNLDVDNLAQSVRSVLNAQKLNDLEIFEHVQAYDGRLLVTPDLLNADAANGNVYLVSNEQNVSGTNEVDILLLQNLSGNTKTIFIQTTLLNSLSAGKQLTYRFYKNPTITANGTLLTISNSNFESANSSEMVSYSSPTISARGTKLLAYITGANNRSKINTNLLGFIIPPNNALLISGQSSATNTISDMTISWVEK